MSNTSASKLLKANLMGTLKKQRVRELAKIRDDASDAAWEN